MNKNIWECWTVNEIALDWKLFNYQRRAHWSTTWQVTSPMECLEPAVYSFLTTRFFSGLLHTWVCIKCTMCFQLFNYSPVSNTEHMHWQDVFAFLRHVLVVRSGLWFIFHKMLLSRRFLKCCYYAVFVTRDFYTNPCKWKLMTNFLVSCWFLFLITSGFLLHFFVF